MTEEHKRFTPLMLFCYYISKQIFVPMLLSVLEIFVLMLMWVRRIPEKAKMKT